MAKKEVSMSDDQPIQEAGKAPKSVAAIIALILSIVALALSLLPIINNFAFILGILALIFGIVGIVGIKGGKKSGFGIAVVSVVIAAIAVIAVIASQATYSAAIDEASKGLDRMTGDATEEILGTDVEVTFGSCTIKKDGYGFIESELPVTIKNLTDERASFSVQLEAADSAGSRISDDTVYVNDLGPGQSQTVKAFTYISSDDYEAMKSAQFALISVAEY